MIYLDNSATTNPKPNSVISSAYYAVKNYSFNSGRGGYKSSVLTSEKIFAARENVGSFFNIEPQNLAFTNNCTSALNYAIKGSVSVGDHIIISSLEHNAAARPVYALAKKGIISYDVAAVTPDDEQTIKNFEELIRPETKLIVCLQASNVFGCILPVREIGKLAKSRGITFVCDVAQSAGVIDIDITRDNIDLLCAPGHKGLYGPMGTGMIGAREGISVTPIIEGGTGTNSLELEQPEDMPEKLESGTLNNIGIIALSKGVDFVKGRGVDKIYSHELHLMQCIYSELSKMDDIELYTPYPEKNRFVPILSFNCKDYSSEKTAELLAQKNIALRAGYHCSMLAHTSYNTLKRGTVRISPSVFTSLRECEYFLNYVKKL